MNRRSFAAAVAGLVGLPVIVKAAIKEPELPYIPSTVDMPEAGIWYWDVVGGDNGVQMGDILFINQRTGLVSNEKCDTFAGVALAAVPPNRTKITPIICRGVSDLTDLDMEPIREAERRGIYF